MKKRLSLSIVSLALLLTGGLASCGKDSSAPGKESGNVTPASEVVSTAESSVQESTVEEKKVTPTTELSEGMEISGLSDEYKLGDTVKFTLTVPDWYVANTVVVKLNDQELTAEKVLDLTTAKKLVFAYVIETELDALRISAAADLISFAPAFVSAPEVEIVGLLEEYNPGSRVEFTLNAPARLTLTEVLVNAEAVLPDADGKYEYTLPMTAKELAIVANVENTKVNVVGSIKSNELDLLPRQAKDVSIQFTQDDVTFIAGEATYAEGALSYSATLPEFGT